MANPFYTASGAPATSSPGASATIRAEFANIAAGFDKLPAVLTANKAVVVNGGGTGLTLTVGSLALAGNFTTTGAFNTIIVQQLAATYTLPNVPVDTLVSRTSMDTLTNKTLTAPTITGGTFTSPTLVTPVLGTPASGTLTNCTGLPISTGVSGLAAGIAAFLATPSSANLLAAMTDETGTGANVFATSPTLITPLLGTPTSGTLTNCTGLPIATGVSGLGANVATFLATPSSANLLAALTTKTGTGSAVFSAAPTFTGTTTFASITASGNIATTAGVNVGGSVTTGVGSGTTATMTNTYIQFQGAKLEGDTGGGGQLTVTGFATTLQVGWSGIFVPNTAPLSNINVVARNNGVVLADSASSWSAISDETLKTPFTPFTDALAKVASIKAGTGRYLTDDVDVSRSFLSAQSVRVVLPEAVSVRTSTPGVVDPNAGKLMLGYTDVIPLLVAALKEAHDRIVILEARP